MDSNIGPAFYESSIIKLSRIFADSPALTFLNDNPRHQFRLPVALRSFSKLILSTCDASGSRKIKILVSL